MPRASLSGASLLSSTLTSSMRLYSLLLAPLAWTLPTWCLPRFEEQTPLDIDAGHPLAEFQHEVSWDSGSQLASAKSQSMMFESVASLLQSWGNMRYHNGHNLVPGTIATGTILYHGSHSQNPPPSKHPEWLAVDPEHSYIFCTSLRAKDPSNTTAFVPSYHTERTAYPNSEICWHHTFVTTRPLHILYFDGASAGKMANGSMDAQDLLQWGEVRDTDRWRYDERTRIDGLCDLWGRKAGRKGGVDGFVRMELDFEVMLCDFEDGLEVVSSLNLAFDDFPDWPSAKATSMRSPYQASGTGEDATAGGDGDEPPPWSEYPPFIYWLPGIEALISGLTNTRYPGETRITLDHARLISFYDEKLFPSLAAARRVPLAPNDSGIPRNSSEVHGDRSVTKRWTHRLDGISRKDVEALWARVAEVLGMDEVPGLPWDPESAPRAQTPTRLDVDNPNSRKLDWKTLIRVVQMRWEERLKVLRDVLLNDWKEDHRFQETNDHDGLGYLKKVHGYVRGMIRPYILNGTQPKSSSSVDEQDGSLDALSWAEDVYRLCATAHTSFMSVQRKHGTLTYSESLLRNAVATVEKEICRVVVGIWAEGVEALDILHGSSSISAQRLLESWNTKVVGLMDWLDWSLWVKCKPACQADEICYLPTWIFFPPPEKGEKGQENYKREPQPRCWSRVHP